MADCKEKPILFRKSSDGKSSSPCQGDLCLSVAMATTPLNGSVEDETLLLKNTFSEGTPLPVINESFINQLKSGMDDSHLFPVFCTKSFVQKRNTANDTINSQNTSWANQTFTKKTSDTSRTKEHELSGSSLDSTLNTSGNKVREITNINPFKKPRDKKVKTSFALDTTQEENVSFEEEQQKFKQMESKINPFKKNLKRKKCSVRFEKTFDSSNENIQETDTTPVKEISISTNNDSICNTNKKGVTQNPFKRSNKRKRYSIVGKLDTSSGSSDKQSETLDIQRSETFSPHNLQVTKENAKHNPFMKVNLRRFSFNATLDTSDVANVNEPDINENRTEEIIEIQQYQPNVSTSGAIQVDLSMKNDENLETEINVSVQKCSEFNESLVSQNDSILIKERSQEITNNVENVAMNTITTIADIDSREEPMTETPSVSMQIPNIETSKVNKNNSGGTLQFVEIERAASKNIDKSELSPNNETVSGISLSSDINLETKDGDKIEENDVPAASSKNVLTSPDERCPLDEVVLNNILSPPISNTSLNSVRMVTKERNNILPTNSGIDNTGQISLKSSGRQVEKEHKIELNHKKPSTISEEESARQSKQQSHGTLSDDVENLSVTTIAEVHSYEESESDSCTEPQDQKVECRSNEARENNSEEISHITEVVTSASQNADNNELLTKATESGSSLGSQINSKNKTEPNGANERDESGIYIEAEAQTGSNGNVLPGVGMATTPLNGSVEDELLLLKNTFSEGTPLPVIDDSFLNQLKSGMDDSHLFPVFCTKSSVQKRNTANDTINSQNSSCTNHTFTKIPSDNSRTKEQELSISSLDSSLNTSGNKVCKIMNTNPFKKTIDKKVKTSFALDTTQEENVSFEEEQQKFKQIESKINPFKKNLKRKKLSVRFEKTFDSSNEYSQITDSRPIKEDSISANNDSVTDENKDHASQNPFKRLIKRKRYSIDGKLDTYSACSAKVDVLRSVISDASNVNDTYIKVNGVEDNTGMQQLNQPNLSPFVDIQDDDLMMENYENVEAEINVVVQKCAEFNESLVSHNDPVKFKELSQENLGMYTIPTLAEIYSRDEPMTENSMESTQILSIEAAEFSENSSEEILQFVENGTVASQNVDKSKLEDDAQAASNEILLKLPVERYEHDEVLSSLISNTTLNSVHGVTEERNTSLPPDSDICNTGQISPESSGRLVERILEKEHKIESNHKKSSNISEETAPQSKQPQATLSNDVGNLSEFAVTTITGIHSCKESESESCTKSENQKDRSNEVKGNNGEVQSHIMAIGKPASQSLEKNELLTKETESCNSLASHVNSENKAESNDANDRDEKQIHKEAEPQTGSNGNESISPGVGMATTPLNGSVEDELLLLKNTFSEETPLPVINESVINHLKSGKDDSHLLPVFCTRSSVQKRNTTNDTINSQNSSLTNQTYTKKISDQSRSKEHEFSSITLDSTLNTSDNKVREIININLFKNLKDKKVNTSFALDTTQEENVSFEEEQQKYKQMESKINPFKKNLKRNKFSVRFNKTFDSSNESSQVTDSRPVKEDSISTNNDAVTDEKKDHANQSPFKLSNQSGRYSIMGKLDNSRANFHEQGETVDIQRAVTSDASSVNYTKVNVKGIEDNTEILQLNQPNLLTPVEIQDLLMKSDEYVELQTVGSAQKFSEFNESLVSQNDSIKTKELSQENLAVCTITTIAEIHSRDEPMTENSMESTQILSIEASEFSENSSEEILLVEIGTAVSQNVDKTELQNSETESCISLSSDINLQDRAETKDARDEIKHSQEDNEHAASNEIALTLPDERYPHDEVVISSILSFPVLNNRLKAVHAVCDERNNSLSSNSEMHKTGQISPAFSERQVEKVLLEKEHKTESSNHKKPSNISKEESVVQSKLAHATLSDDVENLSVRLVTTIAEIHSCKESESEGRTEPTKDQQVECGSNEARENNGGEISQIVIGKPASQNLEKNELLSKETESCNSLASHVNSENKADSNDANERDKKEIHKEPEAQMGSNGNVPISPGKQRLDDEANNIGLGNNLLLSSSSNAIIECAPQLSEKNEIPKNIKEKSKTGNHTMSMICETKNNSEPTIDKNHVLPTPSPRNVEDNDELAVEQSCVSSQTGNGRFSDECDLNKDSGERVVRRKSPRIAGVSANKSYEVVNTSKNTSTKHRKVSKNLKEINSSALMSKGDVDKKMNVSINIASSETSAIKLNCKPDKKSVETNVSNGIQKVASRKEVSKITRQIECLKDMTSELINDESNRDTGSADNQAVDSNKQQLTECGKTRKKNSRSFSIDTAVLKSNTERNKGIAITKRQTPLKDVNKITTDSSKNSSKGKEKPPDSFMAKGNNENFGELSLSFDVSAIPNDKLISSKKRKYKSTPLVQRLTRSKRQSVNVLLQNEKRKSPLGDNLSVSVSEHSKETKKILKEKTANDFEFAAPKFVSRKSSISAVKPRRSVTFRPHSSLIPPPDDSIITIKSSTGNNGRKFSIDVQTSLEKKSKSSMDRNSCKIVSTDVSSKHNNKKIERNSVVDNKTNKDISYETTLEMSEIALQTPKQRKRLLFHSTPKNRITSLGTSSLARKRIRPSDNQETPRFSSSLYSTAETDAVQSDSYTPTFSRTLRNSSSNSSSKKALSYNSHTCMATRITAVSAHQLNQDNLVSNAQSRTKTTSNGVVEPCNSDVLLEESSCFNRPPDDSFSTSYSGVNESVRARSILEESAIIVETQERRSLRNGTMQMTLRSSRTTLQHSAVYSETQLSEITQTTDNTSNLIPEKSLPLISKFSKNKKRKDSVFGNFEKKKVIPHNEPLPKLAKPAKWIKKELYTFLEKKLGTKYKLEKRYHCERLVLILHNAVTNTLMGHPELSLQSLKEELINYGICKTQLDYFTFLHRYTPLAFIKKIVPLGRAYDNGDFKYKKVAAYGTLE